MIPLEWNKLLWQLFDVNELFLLYLYDIEHSFALALRERKERMSTAEEQS